MTRFILSAVIFFNGCAATVPEQNSEKNITPKLISKPESHKKSDGSFRFSTLYWATPRTVAGDDWHAVFGGTVIIVSKESDDPLDNSSRKYVSGAIKIEKVFLNLPDNSEISVNSVIRSEDFDDLKIGDKVIVFINVFYEGDFARVEIEGTNTKLGFKVKDWNEPIVSVLEQIAPCGKIQETWAEGHPEDFRVKMYNCFEERNRIILDEPQVAEIWKRYDPIGFQYLLELRELNSVDNQ